MLAPDRIRRVARSFKKQTTIGVDQLAFSDVAAAPEKALQELSGIFCQAVRTMSLPTCTLINVMATLGKGRRLTMHRRGLDH